MAETPADADRRVRHRLAATREHGADLEDEGEAAPSAPGRLWSSLALWRGLTFVAAVAALALAVALVGRPAKQEQAAAVAPHRYIALLEDPGSKPRWLVTIDVAGGTMIAEPLAPEIPPDRTAELWLIPKGGTPHSLGLLDARATILRPLPSSVTANAADSALTVTLEPAAGSPTGLPTGAVLYEGAAVHQAL